MLFKRNRKPAPQQSPEEKLRSRTKSIAQQLYQNRLILQKEGDEKSDWELAQQIVQSPVRSALLSCHIQFIQLEKRAWEPLLEWANRQALLGIFGLVGNVGIIVAVLTYVGSEKQRRDAEVLNAWQTITNASGQAGSGGRIQALEFLNASPGANWRRRFPWFCAPMSLCVWPAESLAGVNLAVDSLEKANENNSTVMNRDRISANRAYLSEIQLPNASLHSANLEGAVLLSANLEGAILAYSNLKGAILVDANLEGAGLRSANLEGTNLSVANLKGAGLGSANLEGTNLSVANLEGANLSAANLEGANLSAANLEGANLSAANLKGAVLEEANLEGAVLFAANLKSANLSAANLEGIERIQTKQLTQAKLCRTKLPTGIDLSENRDCAELGIDLERGFE